MELPFQPPESVEVARLESLLCCNAAIFAPFGLDLEQARSEHPRDVSNALELPGETCRWTKFLFRRTGTVRGPGRTVPLAPPTIFAGSTELDCARSRQGTMSAGNSWHCEGSPFGSFWCGGTIAGRHLTMTISCSTPRSPLVASTLFAGFPSFPAPPSRRRRGSRAALVGTADMGRGGEARGYQIPYPFGIGITAYSARQPGASRTSSWGWGAMAASGVGQELPADQSGRTRPSRTYAASSTSWSSRSWTSTRSVDTRREPPRGSSW